LLNNESGNTTNKALTTKSSINAELHKQSLLLKILFKLTNINCTIKRNIVRKIYININLTNQIKKIISKLYIKNVNHLINIKKVCTKKIVQKIHIVNNLLQQLLQDIQTYYKNINTTISINSLLLRSLTFRKAILVLISNNDYMTKFISKSNKIKNNISICVGRNITKSFHLVVKQLIKSSKTIGKSLRKLITIINIITHIFKAFIPLKYRSIIKFKDVPIKCDYNETQDKCKYTEITPKITYKEV
jgi:hypothetical protein